MSDKELIKQEIERRKVFHDKAMKACNGLNTISITHAAAFKEDEELTQFIDSLPEESGCEVNFTIKNEDLEEDCSFEKTLQEIYIKYDKKISIESLLDIASHFAEWQKQQMMKDAVEAIVHQGLYSKYVKECDDEALANVLKNHNSGDRVKIIIIKTE